VTMKAVALEPVPALVVTVIGPVAAPTGTVVVICVAVLVASGLTGVTAGSVPLLKATVAPVRLLPTMVIKVPTPPLFGLNPVMTGAGAFGAPTPADATSMVTEIKAPTLANALKASTVAGLAAAVLVTGIPLEVTRSYAEAVKVQAPAVPSFANVVDAVSPAVVSVRVESRVNPVSDNNADGFSFDFNGRGFDDLPDDYREQTKHYKKKTT